MDYRKKCPECGTDNNAESDKCHKCQAPLGVPYDPILAESIWVALDKSVVRVEVKDFDMPFWAIVGWMVKWAIASIPAFVILVIVFIVMLAMLFGVGMIPRY